MAIDYYSKKVITAFIPSTISTSKSRYDTKIRLKTNSGTAVRFIRHRDLVLDSDESTVYVVTAADEYRPDLIAHKVYGDATYYWAILAANNLGSALDVSIGTTLVIPSVGTLWGSKGAMITR